MAPSGRCGGDDHLWCCVHVAVHDFECWEYSNATIAPNSVKNNPPLPAASGATMQDMARHAIAMEPGNQQIFAHAVDCTHSV
jgi:hypothetical protein